MIRLLAGGRRQAPLGSFPSLPAGDHAGGLLSRWPHRRSWRIRGQLHSPPRHGHGQGKLKRIKGRSGQRHCTLPWPSLQTARCWLCAGTATTRIRLYDVARGRRRAAANQWRHAVGETTAAPGRQRSSSSAVRRQWLGRTAPDRGWSSRRTANWWSVPVGRQRAGAPSCFLRRGHRQGTPQDRVIPAHHQLRLFAGRPHAGDRERRRNDHPLGSRQRQGAGPTGQGRRRQPQAQRRQMAFDGRRRWNRLSGTSNRRPGRGDLLARWPSPGGEQIGSVGAHLGCHHREGDRPTPGAPRAASKPWPLPRAAKHWPRAATTPRSCCGMRPPR